MSALESSDLTLPFIEVGDTVRLKDPYQPRDVHPKVAATMRRHIFTDPEIDTQADRPDNVSLDLYRDVEAAQQYLAFSHGTVVEALSQYSRGAVDLEAAQAVLPANPEPRNWPRRNVSLHLHNLQTGLVYYDQGAGTRGVPCHVDEHTANHVLIQKADKSYGHRETALAALHRELGITEA